jgi:hypothetical protein
MTDQGWMVDDGTCLSCLQGQDWLCTNPMGWDAGDRVSLTCCCDEGYDLGDIALDDEDGEP